MEGGSQGRWDEALPKRTPGGAGLQGTPPRWPGLGDPQGPSCTTITR